MKRANDNNNNKFPLWLLLRQIRSLPNVGLITWYTCLIIIVIIALDAPCTICASCCRSNILYIKFYTLICNLWLKRDRMYVKQKGYYCPAKDPDLTLLHLVSLIFRWIFWGPKFIHYSLQKYIQWWVLQWWIRVSLPLRPALTSSGIKLSDIEDRSRIEKKTVCQKTHRNCLEFRRSFKCPGNPPTIHRLQHVPWSFKTSRGAQPGKHAWIPERGFPRKISCRKIFFLLPKIPV